MDTNTSMNARFRMLVTQTKVGVLSGNRTSIDRGTDYILVSVVDGFSYDLPELPPGFGFPIGGECIFLDGKVYTFGGMTHDGVPGDAVYVMDFAGHRQWEHCKSMPYASCCAGAMIPLNGKIYVCDGEFYALGDPEYVRNDVVQIFDPLSHTWDVIEVMPGARCFDLVPGLEDAEEALGYILGDAASRLDVLPQGLCFEGSGGALPGGLYF